MNIIFHWQNYVHLLMLYLIKLNMTGIDSVKASGCRNQLTTASMYIFHIPYFLYITCANDFNTIVCRSDATSWCKIFTVRKLEKHGNCISDAIFIRTGQLCSVCVGFHTHHKLNINACCTQKSAPKSLSIEFE